MNVKGSSLVVWVVIILILFVLVFGFMYAAYVFESEQVENESVDLQNNVTNISEGEVEVVSDVAGVLKIVRGAFS